MSYTDNEYLDRIILIAIEDNVITSDDAYRIIGTYGSNHDNIVIDILWRVSSCRSDKKKLEEIQAVYREYRNSLHQQ